MTCVGVYFRKITTFVLANSSWADFAKKPEWLRGGSTTFWKCVADALF